MTSQAHGQDERHSAGTILDIGGQSFGNGWGTGAIEVRESNGGAAWSWRKITKEERQVIIDALNTRATPASRDGTAGTRKAGWGDIVQLLLRAMDTSPKTENASALAERMADGVERLYGKAPPKPAPDALRERIAKIVCCHGPCILEGCDPGCIACSPEHPVALETADLILAALSPAPVPPADGVGDAEQRELDEDIRSVLIDEGKLVVAPLPAGAAEAATWLSSERETVARAIFGDGWQCCANLGPYVQDAVNELNEARQLLAILPEDLVEHQRDLIEQTKDTTHQPLTSPPLRGLRGEREALIRELCGDELNGGLIRDLCFTVWTICHSPKHEDGNSDWSSDTLPTVQKAVEIVRSKLSLQSGAGEGETKP